MESLEYYLAARYKRLLAYLIDILPIVSITFLLCYNFFGLDEVWSNYLHKKENLLSRVEFLQYRNRIRDFSFLIWIIYAFILEASAQQATLGKRLMRIKVIDASGKRLSFKQSAIRNFCKILSYIPLSLGFLWLIFDRNRQGWHDKIGGTFVVDADFEIEEANIHVNSWHLSQKEPEKLEELEEVQAPRYFKVINPFYLRYHYEEDQGYKDEMVAYSGDINLQVGNQYFEFIYFYSTTMIERVLFQIFLTFNETFRREEFFQNTNVIQRYFKDKYDIPFFDREMEQRSSEFEHSWSYLERKMTLKDFTTVVLKNLNFSLLEEIIAPQPNHLYFNWDFFEETKMFPNQSNGLYLALQIFPAIEPNKWKESNQLKINALQYLISAVSFGPDTEPKGLFISEDAFIEGGLYNFTSPLFSIHKVPEKESSPNKGYKFYPKENNFLKLYNSLYDGNQQAFLHDYEQLMASFAKGMLPFQILQE